MFGTGSKATNAKRLSGVQLNSSSYAQPVPIVYGTTRISTNLIDTDDFKAKKHSSGGKGGGSGGTTYTYKAAVILGLCEGPISGVNNIYKGRAPLANPDSHGNTPLQQESLTLFTGLQSQAAWSYMSSNHPTKARAYAGTAYLANATMMLDSSGGVPNYNLEVQGLSIIGGGNLDANPADIIADFLTNARYGAGFPSASIASLTDYRNYCTASGFFFSPAYTGQQQVQQMLTDLALWSNSEIVWSQGQVKFIPYGDMTLVGNGVTWVPSLGIAYVLNDDSYLDQGGQDPLSVTRSSPSDAYNDIKIEFTDRSKNYNLNVAEAWDQNAVDQYGIRTQNAASAHGICVASIAQLSVQLQLQRSVNLRNVYEFSLPMQFCLLEPMDLIQINDTTLGYTNLTVRVTEIEEDDNMNLKVTAEDFILGVGTAPGQNVQPNAGYVIPQQAAPGNVSTPQFFTMPALLVSNAAGGNQGVNLGQTLQLGIAVAGTGINWGGCEVWVSLDNATYNMLATVNRGASAGNMNALNMSMNDARYGTLTANYPSHADPDTTDTLSVDLAPSQGQLVSASSAQAAAAATLAILGGLECISYTTATLTTGFAYNLTGTIRRGQAGTPIGAHIIGDSFVRLDDGIVRYSYMNEQIGQTVYFKFLSFNLFGNSIQALSDVGPYSVVLTPPGTVPIVGTPAIIPGAVTTPVSVSSPPVTTLAPGSGFVSVINATIISTGAPIVIMFSMTLELGIQQLQGGGTQNGSVSVRIIKDGVTATPFAVSGASAGGKTAFAVMLDDSPAAGSHTYDMQVSNTGGSGPGNAKVSNMTAVLLETKR